MPFFPEMSANFTSYIVQNIYIALAWILYPLNFSPLPFDPKKPKHSSSNHGLFCLNSSKPRLSFAEVWIFSLMFYQVLFTSSSSSEFYKAANLFVISIWKVRDVTRYGLVGRSTAFIVTVEEGSLQYGNGIWWRSCLFNDDESSAFVTACGKFVVVRVASHLQHQYVRRKRRPPPVWSLVIRNSFECWWWRLCCTGMWRRVDLYVSTKSSVRACCPHLQFVDSAGNGKIKLLPNFDTDGVVARKTGILMNVARSYTGCSRTTGCCCFSHFECKMH